MRAAWKIVCLSAAVLAAAIVIAQLLVPDIVPIAFAEEPQPSWAVMTAFVLCAIELMTAAVAVIALAMLVGMCAQRGLRRLSRGTATQAD
ncbi:hypothetical protein [Bradyrhizobium sp. CCBAU 45389]|uniref:hypothetical protein n=1 Tax=Bradyrhizobium sp. CCBAU 45389 TaxID=858429 RepID=UPI002305116D|nr:hypothetical protein [Bradyrhizobium sp. CCBAU 45389]MDA9404836.1 hypothetical protein [Bradyrhizobium sp. CCBAU 45389]